MDDHAPGSIWPVTDLDEVQIREVYSRYGLAMYMAQVLEHGMVNAMIVMRTLPTLHDHHSEQSWQATFDGAYEAGLARTYGNMLRQLEAIDEFPRDLLTRLVDAKRDRDILAHRFFRDNDVAFMSVDGRTAMIAWCEGCVELFKTLSDEIDDVIAPIRARHGISQAWIDQALARSLEDARNWSPGASSRP